MPENYYERRPTLDKIEGKYKATFGNSLDWSNMVLRQKEGFYFRIRI